MQNYLRLLSFLKHHKRIFLPAVFFMGISSLFEGIQFSLLVPLTDILFTHKKVVVPPEAPAFIGTIVGYVNSIDSETLFKFLIAAVAGLILVKNFVTFWYGYLMNDLSQRIMRDIRDQLYAKIQNLSLDYFSKKRGGELISRITNDVLLIENATSYGVTDLFRQTFTVLVFVIIAFAIHPKAAFIVFFILPLVAVPMSQIGRRLRKLAKSSQERMADINTLLLETISGVKVVKAFCTEDYEIDRFKRQNFDFYKIRMKSIKRILLISPATEILGFFCGIVIILWLGRQVMDQHLSFGVFTLFMGSIMSIISPIKKLGNVNAITQQALAASERIYDVLDAKITVMEKPKASFLPVLRNKITIENVSFQYDEESGGVLQDINLEIKCGELVAVVGPTGTGKSTLVNLIPRFYDSTQGAVRFDGVNVRDVTFASLRGQIGIVTQENILFNDTVQANISYGYRKATQAEIEEAARKAFAHQFIIKMPQGYETFIGDRGFRLSGGEKQRIAIARAILKNPPILILDEATSQLDSESEKFVQEALDKLMQGRTVIAIAHRLSTIKKANKIVVLEHGRIVGLGTHDELLETCALYQRLYETQFNM
ncbi:MAG: hypothetical protein A2787_06275 [Omnitrophica WOR_2 bacterium RIFCSPHIGHO2_01_FULL_48_9]|nr:MAG: hypothetical protein A3D10_01265 [Omnitrophica WOR_2 bacterium RIFCSPHIGHO2_02_FULL_48_11]OGX34516.1 MAG: hypothetical protein A2787_06275 [Omnitrophica WOR_2 bacterium RIFCSPHIGHO2_01_FULL_48_9]